MASNFSSAEEILAKYQAGMGKPLGLEFHHCRQQYFEVTYLWDVYLTLFRNKESAKLLNDSFSALAVHIKNQFLNGVAIGVSRLLDPPIQGKFENMTLARVCDACPEKLKASASPQLLSAYEKAEKLRSVRNKLIAHNDYLHATKQLEPLEYGTVEEITALLKLLLDFLNEIDRHFLGQTTALLPLGNLDGRNLLRYLFYSHAIRGKMRDEALGKSITLQDLRDLPEFLKGSKQDDERYGLKMS